MVCSNVLVVVDYFQAGSFFVRLASFDQKRRYHIITTLPSVKRLANENNISCELVYSTGFGVKESGREINSRDRVREVKSSAMSLANANKYHKKLFGEIDYYLSNNEIDYIAVWNGEDVIGYTCRCFDRVAKLLFFEIANINGKIFVDTMGVNASSSLYSKLDRLDNLDFNESDYELWKEEYILGKKEQKTLKQAEIGKKIRIDHFSDFLYSSLYAGQSYSFHFIINKVKAKIGKTTLDIDVTNKKFDNYVFFPMQVSNDSQILLNSKFGGNFEVAEYLVENYPDVKVLVKPHPAEQDGNYLHDFFSKYKNNFIFTNENTFDLILNANEIFTINSTVGLEALILNKKVTFLGESIFDGFNDERLKKYIMSFLVNFDFFDRVDIDYIEVDRIFNV